MADLIKIKGGKGAIPKLQDREPAYSKDEQALYIGTEDGNLRLCGAEDVTRITALETKITALEGQISTILTRLDALEKSK